MNLFKSLLETVMFSFLMGLLRSREIETLPQVEWWGWSVSMCVELSDCLVLMGLGG